MKETERSLMSSRTYFWIKPLNNFLLQGGWSNVRKYKGLSVLESSFEILSGSDSNKGMPKRIINLLSYLMRKVFITNILNVCILVSFTSSSQEVPEKQILQHTVEIPEGQGNGNVLTLQSERQVCILPNEAIKWDYTGLRFHLERTWYSWLFCRFSINGRYYLIPRWRMLGSWTVL